MCDLGAPKKVGTFIALGTEDTTMMRRMNNYYIYLLNATDQELTPERRCNNELLTGDQVVTC